MLKELKGYDFTLGQVSTGHVRLEYFQNNTLSNLLGIYSSWSNPFLPMVMTDWMILKRNLKKRRSLAY